MVCTSEDDTLPFMFFFVAAKDKQMLSSSISFQGLSEETMRKTAHLKKSYDIGFTASSMFRFLSL